MATIRIRTETTPVSQAAGNDYTLPEIAGHIAHFTDDEAKEETEDTINQGNQKYGTDRGNILLGECGDDAGKDERREGKVQGYLGSTPGRNLGEEVFPSKVIPNEHGNEASNTVESEPRR